MDTIRRNLQEWHCRLRRLRWFAFNATTAIFAALCVWMVLANHPAAAFFFGFLCAICCVRIVDEV